MVNEKISVLTAVHTSAKFGSQTQDLNISLTAVGLLWNLSDYFFQNQDTLKGETKDHIDKLDFQEHIFAVVNWPNSEFYRALVCIMHYFYQSPTNQLAKVFLILGCGFL